MPPLYIILLTKWCLDVTSSMLTMRLLISSKNISYVSPIIRFFFTKYGNSSTVANVHSAKTCVIDSQCEVIIPAYLSKPVDSVVGLVEANQKFSDAYNLMGASILAIPDQYDCVTIRFINPNDTPVLLYKGTCIRTFCTLTTDDVIADVKGDPTVSTMKKENPPTKCRKYSKV